ncbi:MAG: LacI family DNA-binding transcriptional regulator [Bacilli bacterium]
MATIRDVARQAEVGIATVSRFLNGGYISDEKKTRVLRAIHELDFRINEVARSLSTGRSKAVGLVFPDLNNPFVPGIIHGIEETCENAGVMVMLAHTAEREDRVEAVINNLIQRGVDGLISASGLEDPGSVPVPLVMLDRVNGTSAVDSIRTDHVQGGEIATRYLLSKGHRDILFLSGPLQNTGASLRLQGYKQMMEDAGFQPQWIEGKRFDFAEGYAIALERLKQGETSAIFAGNDLMALGVVRAAMEIGLQIPDDLSVVGYDGIDLSAHTTPSLTTVAQPMYELGKQAATMVLFRAYEESKRICERVELTPKLLIRGTA